MNILHFSNSSLAGAPKRLVDVLQRHTKHDVRLVDATRYDFSSQRGWFEYDLVFDEAQEQVLELARTADVLHLHNTLDLDSADFAPLDFRRLQADGKLVLRHFHTPPDHVAVTMGCNQERVTACELPCLVVSQYPERFYPNARVVPNVLPHNDSAYLPLAPEHDGEPDTDILFSTANMASAWTQRWIAKGAPETMDMMNRVSELTGCTIATLHKMALVDVLKRKRRARIVIDDLVGGSFHLSGLEGVSMGKPVLAYLDNRTDFVLREISGASGSPFLNVRLEDAVEVLTYLVERPEETTALGQNARSWLETYWRDDLLAGHFDHVYNRLAQDPKAVARQRALRLDGPGALFTARKLPDLLYQSRKNRALGLE